MTWKITILECTVILFLIFKFMFGSNKFIWYYCSVTRILIKILSDIDLIAHLYDSNHNVVDHAESQVFAQGYIYSRWCIVSSFFFLFLVFWYFLLSRVLGISSISTLQWKITHFNYRKFWNSIISENPYNQSTLFYYSTFSYSRV